MKFTLTIDLQDGHDQPLTLIVSTLRNIAATVQSQGILFEQTRAIDDHNGVTRGEWTIEEDGPATPLDVRRRQFDRLDDAIKAAAPEDWIIAVDAPRGTLTYYLTPHP